MRNQDVTFNENGIIHSKTFGDIYFNPKNGIAESTHVFLDNNAFPARWNDGHNHTICELGFGTGLNCILTARLFEEHKKPQQQLHIISTEKYPLDKDTLNKALTPFKSKLAPYVDHLIQDYPLLIKGAHRIHLTPSVQLTLIFGDSADILSRLEHPMDTWFLDGFNPSENPDMWSDDIFKHIGRLSHSETHLSTFTAAGFVRRGLGDIGFNIKKTDGFGQKREMLCGQFTKNNRPKHKPVKNAHIIGAGLAGATCAYALANKGLDVHIYDQSSHPPEGASSNEIGLINPKPSVGPTTVGTLSLIGYDLLLRRLSQLSKDYDLSFRHNGNIHLIDDGKKAQKYQKLIDSKRFDKVHLDYTDTNHDAIIYPDAGACSPKALVRAYLDKTNINKNFNFNLYHIDNYNLIEKGNVVFSHGMGAQDILTSLAFQTKLQPVRGQTTTVKIKDHKMETGLCYGGYATPIDPDHLCIGSTYDHNHDQPQIFEEDNQYNIEQFCTATGLSTDTVEVKSSWAGIRVATKYREPIYGLIDKSEGYFASLALGSHGMVLGTAIAEIISDQMLFGYSVLDINFD